MTKEMAPSQGYIDITNVKPWAEEFNLDGTIISRSKSRFVPSEYPPAVLIPGLGSSGNDLRRVAEGLEAHGHEVVAINAARSQRLGRKALNFLKPHISEFGKATAEAIEELFPGQKVNVIGHSFGTIVANYLGINHGNLVNSEVLYTPAVGDMPFYIPTPPKIESALGLFGLSLSTDARARAIGGDFEDDPELFEKLNVMQSHDAEATSNQRWAAITSMGSIGLRLFENTAPVLVLASKEDKVTPYRNSVRLSRGLPNGSLQVIDKDTRPAGHGFPFSRSVATANATHHYLANLPSDAAPDSYQTAA